VYDSLNSSDQIPILEWRVMTLAVDEERWGAVEATENSACKIGADPGQEFTFLKSCEQVRRGKSRQGIRQTTECSIHIRKPSPNLRAAFIGVGLSTPDLGRA
jgi:hypothetical protein